MSFTCAQLGGGKLQAPVVARPASGAVPKRRNGPRTSRAASILTSDRAALGISKLRPLGTRLLVKPNLPDEKTSGGVLLPSSGGGAPSLAAGVGAIVAVGARVSPELGLAAGDVVLYSQYGTSDVDAAEGEAVFVDEKAVIAKLAS